MNLSLLRGVVIAAVIYGCYALLLYLGQRAIMYPGRGIRVEPAPPPGSPGLSVSRLDTGSGKVETWFLPARRAARGGRSPALIFFHGNGEVIDFLPGQVEGLRRLGLHVMLVEYPGYGRSTGAPSEASITAAAVAAFDALGGRPDVDPARIIAFGRSVGGGPACALSRQRPLAALILQSAFTSTRPFARRFLLPGFLVRDLFDNLAAVRRFTGPMLVAHGRRDDIIPFSHGQELSRAGRDVKFIEFDCSHNDCPPDLDVFWRTVGEWLKQQKIL
ncbi:putative protein [Geobacter sp. OR-1]|uniref:alpha/beta hydrolase n=1 Tax=Geobacter sp. OR-1 TaxID=1266765 RepID=UPI000541A62C|nr:alpha/beta hydrolase [Geobacter sp. OR-1]GAM08558.1 putative protein [Geobacter sp. OR-1]